MPDEVINDIPAVDTRKNLLEQDDAQTLVTLVNAAGTVTVLAGNCNWWMKTGRLFLTVRRLMSLRAVKL